MGDLGKRVKMVMIIEALRPRGDFDLMENKPQNLSCDAFALLSFCFCVRFGSFYVWWNSLSISVYLGQLTVLILYIYNKIPLLYYSNKML